MNKKILKEKYGDEKVFIVPYDKTTFIEDKFTPIKHNVEVWKMFDSIGEYIYRYDAENNPEFQQIIPYILIFNNDKNLIYATKRIAGDSRLVNKISIGFGGHINECDGNKEVIFKAAVRELFEEADVEPTTAFNIIGYIRDITSKTNDHLGIVISLCANDDIKILENDNLIGQWVSLDELINSYNKMENWSKYIVDYFATQKQFK